MSPLTVRQLSASNTTPKNNAVLSTTISIDGENSSYMPLRQDAQDLYPQTHIVGSNGIKLQSSTESLVSKIVRSADCHQSAKSSGTLADSLRNIKNQIRSTPLENNGSDPISSSEERHSTPGRIPNGYVEAKLNDQNSPDIKPSSFHRPSLAAAIATTSFSGEERAMTPTLKPPKSKSGNSAIAKVKAVFQNIKSNTNKSKILMVLALCILCLPGNIVTIWLKLQQHEERPRR